MSLEASYKGRRLSMTCDQDTLLYVGWVDDVEVCRAWTKGELVKSLKEHCNAHGKG